MRQQSTNPIAYIFRHLAFFALCGFLPACFLAFTDTSSASANFWVSYFLGDVVVASFFSEYIAAHLIISHSFSWTTMLTLVVCWVSLTMAWSVMVYRTDRHMQLGIRIRDDLFGKSMGMALRVAMFILIMFVMDQLSLLLIVGVMYVMNSFILYEVTALTILILTALQRLAMFVALYVFMVALPAIAAENYSLVSALGYSARLYAVRKDHSQTVLVVAISMLMYMISLIVQLIGIPSIVSTIIVGLMQYAWIIAIPVAVCARFITDIDTERRDVENNLF